eukprot:g951.t1
MKRSSSESDTIESQIRAVGPRQLPIEEAASRELQRRFELDQDHHGRLRYRRDAPSKDPPFLFMGDGGGKAKGIKPGGDGGKGKGKAKGMKPGDGGKTTGKGIKFKPGFYGGKGIKGKGIKPPKRRRSSVQLRAEVYQKSGRGGGGCSGAFLPELPRSGEMTLNKRPSSVSRSSSKAFGRFLSKAFGGEDQMSTPEDGDSQEGQGERTDGGGTGERQSRGAWGWATSLFGSSGADEEKGPASGTLDGENAEGLFTSLWGSSAPEATGMIGASRIPWLSPLRDNAGTPAHASLVAILGGAAGAGGDLKNVQLPGDEDGGAPDHGDAVVDDTDEQQFLFYKASREKRASAQKIFDEKIKLAILASRSHLDEAVARSRVQLDAANSRSREMLDLGITQNRQSLDEAVAKARSVLDVALSVGAAALDENEGAIREDLLDAERTEETRRSELYRRKLAQLKNVEKLLLAQAEKVDAELELARQEREALRETEETERQSQAVRARLMESEFRRGMGKMQEKIAQVKIGEAGGGEERRSSPTPDADAVRETSGIDDTVPVTITNLASAEVKPSNQQRKKPSFGDATEKGETSGSGDGKGKAKADPKGKQGKAQAANESDAAPAGELVPDEDEGEKVDEEPSIWGNVNDADEREIDEIAAARKPQSRSPPRGQAEGEAKEPPLDRGSDEQPRLEEKPASRSNPGASPYLEVAPSNSKSATPIPRPLLVATLAGVSKLALAKWAFTGWFQSSMDEATLQDSLRTPAEKVLALFGVQLDWTSYLAAVDSGSAPTTLAGHKVLVTEVATGSRAETNGVAVGDALVLISGEKISSVREWVGFSRSAPETAIVQKVQRSYARLKQGGQLGKASICGFIFLRKKYATQYLQLSATVPSSAASDGDNGRIIAQRLGFEVLQYNSGSLGTKVLQVGKVQGATWAAQQGLQQKDIVVMVNERPVIESANAPLLSLDEFWQKVGTVLASSKSASGDQHVVEFLFRRPTGWPTERIVAEENATVHLDGADHDKQLVGVQKVKESPSPGRRDTTSSTPPPFLVSQLAGVSKLSVGKWGFAGWYQSSIDEALLMKSESDAADDPDHFLRVFGFALDWRRFPKVVVTHVEPDSRAVKNGVGVGDFLVLISGEKIQSVKQWAGFTRAAPEKGILAKVQRAYTRQKQGGQLGKAPVCGFMFLRKKYAGQYLQAAVTRDEQKLVHLSDQHDPAESNEHVVEEALGFQLIQYKSGSLATEILQVAKVLEKTQSGSPSWAQQNGLNEKDVVVMLNDRHCIAESQGALKLEEFRDLLRKTCGDGGNAGVELLIRRVATLEGWPQDRLAKEEERIVVGL